MKSGPRTGRPLVVSTLSPSRLEPHFPSAEFREVAPSIGPFFRELERSRERTDGRARPIIAVLGSMHPQLVLAAVRAKADRIAVVFDAPLEGALRIAGLRAAFAFVDLTVVPDEATGREAILAGADPDRLSLAGLEIERRLLAEPPRGRDRTTTIEAIASAGLDAVSGLGLLGALERVTQRQGVNVVNYHRVLDLEAHRVYGRPQMAIADLVFSAQLATISERRAFIDISRVHDPSASGSVVVTFDDGYEDNYRVALPVLERFDVPACIFVATDLVGSEDAAFWDRVQLALFTYWRAGAKRPVPAELPASCAKLEEAESVSEARAIITSVLSELNAMAPEKRAAAVEAAERLAQADGERPRTMLSWAEIEEMARRGIRFGSHTKSHICLDEVSPDVAKEELLGGHATLRAKLPADAPPTDTVALPRGKLGPFKAEDLRAQGFSAVMTTEARINPPVEGELFVHRRDGKMLTLRGRHHAAKLRLELTGIPDRLRRVLGAAGGD